MWYESNERVPSAQMSSLSLHQGSNLRVDTAALSGQRSWTRGRYVIGTSLVPLKTHCAEQKGLKHVKCVAVQTFSHWWKMWKLGEGLPAHVSVSSFDHGSKLRATRGLLATDHVILNHGQVTWTTPELAPPLLTTTPHQREDVSALDRFNVHRCPTRRVFSGTEIELVTRQAMIRYLYHSATTAVSLRKQ
ncbi:uncharacterized protein TNCV_3592931 [Trichonephila clavipes]|nr:uncharacterized protein TNCV_3592931 [Trichonephila clavipes]